MQIVVESGKRLNLTSTNSSLSGVTLMGVFVSQASASPTLQVADAAGNIANTFTPIAGTYYPLPCRTTGTLTVTIGGTVDCTVFYAS